MGFMNRDKVIEDNVARAQAELDEAIASERPEQAAPPADPKEALPSSPGIPEVVDGVNWKERYGNLQRFIDKNLKPAHRAEIDKLQADVKKLEATINEMIRKASPNNLPETLEEVENLKRENPAAYAAIMKVATDVAQGLVDDQLSRIRADVEDIKKVRKETAEEAAFVELQRRFPNIDILALEEDEDFRAWISKKSKRTQDAILENKSDVDAASDVLQLYTLEVLEKKSKSAARPKGVTPGAELVAPKSGNSAVPAAGVDYGWDYTESQLEEMDRKSPRWFEQNLEKIDAAARKGRILKDITDPIGSARRMAAVGVA